MPEINKIAKVPSFDQTNLAQAAAVQNTWYEICDLRNVEVMFALMNMQTLAEDLECRFTIDGKVISGSQAAAVAGTSYHLYVNPTSTSYNIVPSTTLYLAGKEVPLKAKSFKFEIRKTSANGANELRGNVIYHQW